MSILVVSASLNPKSRSRILAQRAWTHLQQLKEPGAFLDLQKLPLPLCDGGAA